MDADTDIDAPMNDEPRDEQAEAQVRSTRARKALVVAPGLAEHLRRQLTPADGRTERGWAPGDRTPLLTGVADAADELYVLLYAWAQSWAFTLREAVPVAPMWRNREGGELGLRGGTSPRAARMLVESQSYWLLNHHEQIGGLLNGGDYQDEISALVWQLRAASGLVGPPGRRGSGVREKSLLDCEQCELPEIRVEYFGSPISSAELRGDELTDVQAVDVYCAHCGWSPELKPASVAKWLQMGTSEPASIEEIAQTREVLARSHAGAERQDVELPFWSIQQTALHFGVTPRTIRRYITDGMPSYFAGTMVKPAEVIAETLARRDRARATRKA